MRSKKVVLGGLTAALGISVALVVPFTADAATSGCGYPSVCLYRGSTNTAPTGRFRQVTSGWQWLGASRGTTSVVNTRHDDVVYLLTTKNKTICVRPGATGGLIPGAGGFKAVRISWSSRC